MCLCRKPGLDFAPSLLKRNVEFLNVTVEEVPQLVQKLCQALGVPAPADFAAEREPAAKKAKTGADLELENGVHAFCRAWEAGVADRARRELDKSRPDRVLAFIKDTAYMSERVTVGKGDSLLRVVTSIDVVRALLNKPAPSPEVGAQIASLELSVLKSIFALKGENLCLVDITNGVVETLPAGPWNEHHRYHLPEDADANWTVVLRGQVELCEDCSLSVHCMPQQFLVLFIDHVLRQCEGRTFMSYPDQSAVPPASVGWTANLGGETVNAAPADAFVDAHDQVLRPPLESTLDVGGLEPTDFQASVIRELSQGCALQLYDIAQEQASRYNSWLATRGASASKITSPRVFWKKADPGLPTPFCTLVRPPSCHACVLLLFGLVFPGSRSCTWRA